MNDPLETVGGLGHHTIQIRVPHFSGKSIVGAILLGALLAATAWAVYRHHEIASRIYLAQQELAPIAQTTFAQTERNLDQAEQGFSNLSNDIDQGLTATSSQGINVNDYLSGESRTEGLLTQATDSLNGLDQKAASLRSTYRLPSGTELLTAEQTRQESALKQRQQTDIKQLASIDDRIKLAAQHRESMASAEAAKAKAHAEAQQAQQQASASTPPPPPVYAAAPYPYYPYYPYGYDPYYYDSGPSIWIGGFWGGRGGWGHGGWHGGHR